MNYFFRYQNLFEILEVTTETYVGNVSGRQLPTSGTACQMKLESLLNSGSLGGWSGPGRENHSVVLRVSSIFTFISLVYFIFGCFSCFLLLYLFFGCFQLWWLTTLVLKIVPFGNLARFNVHLFSS